MWNFKTFIKKSEGCFVLLLCALCPSFVWLVKKMNFKISSVPHLGPVGFHKNKTPKVLFEN